MKIDIWMPLYVADYLADTMHLATMQHGAYLLLMMHHWRAGDLPDDDRQLAAIARLAPAEWGEIAPVIRPFFDAVDGRLTQKRLVAEMERARGNKTVNIARATRGAEARWGKKGAPGNAPSIAQALPEICLSATPSTSSERIESNAMPSVGENASKNASSIAPGNAPSMLEQCTSPSPINTSYLLSASHSASLRKAGRQDEGSRLPENWQPSSEDREYAENLGLNVDRVAEEFQGYWLTKPGKDGRKARWNLVWQRWCRTAAHKPSARAHAPANSNGPLFEAPRRYDPPEKWLHLAEKTELDPSDGILKAVIGGYYINMIADQVCEAGRLDDAPGGDWGPVIRWLRDGLDPVAQILPAIRRIANGPNYTAPGTFRYFDRAVREMKAA